MSKLNSWSARRVAAAALLVLSCTSAARAAGAGQSGAPPPTRARSAGKAAASSDLPRVLAKASEAGKLTATTAAAALLAAGPEATSALFVVAENRGAPDATWAALLPVQRQRIRNALDGAAAVVVDISSLAQLSPKERLHAYSVALEVLAPRPVQIAGPLLGRLLAGASSRRLPRALIARVERTVARLAEDPLLTSSRLVEWILSGGTGLASAIVDGAARADALMTLVGCLHYTTGAEGIILNRVAGMIQGGAPVDAEVTAAVVFPSLQSHRVFERREACAVIGMVGDRRHVGALIHGLEDDEHMVRTAALKALKALTGMTISGDASRWKQWSIEQETWWEGEGSTLVASITSADRSELISILKEVSSRRLYRREIAPQLVQLLNRQRADEVRVAVASLATLRDPSTLDPILELRDHPNPLVRSSVEDAVLAFRHAGIKPARVRALPSH